MQNIFTRGVVVFLSIIFTSQAFVSAQTATTVANSSGVSCTNLTSNLSLGSRDILFRSAPTNPQVTNLQKFLKETGYLSSQPTGYFGGSTLTALQAFQRGNGIPPSSSLGSVTRAKIKEITCQNSSVISPTTISGNPSVAVVNHNLRLSYDTNRKESSLVANFYVRVAAPNTDIKISKPDRGVVQDSYYFSPELQKSGIFANVSGQGQLTNITQVSDEGDYYLLRAGQIAYFNYRQTYEPKRLYAGQHSAVLSIKEYSGRMNSLLATTNSVVVVGEANGREPSASVSTEIASPSFRLEYDSFNKESVLRATYYITIEAGADPLKIYKRDVLGIEASYFVVHLKNNDGSSTSISPLPAVVSLASGEARNEETLYELQPGKRAIFKVEQTYNPKIIFGGVYNASLGFYNYKSSGSMETLLSGVVTNPVTVVGEVSPYISSATSDANGNVTLQGARFDLQENILNVDGVSLTGMKGDATTGFFTTTSGGHFVKITNTRTGDSNQVYVNVVMAQQPETPRAPTVSVVGSPTLAITYDSARKESAITATFDVSVTAGTNPFQVYRSTISETPMHFFGVSLKDSNGNTSSGYDRVITSFRSGFARGDGTIFTLEPGKTSTFRVVQTFNPKILFAGAYTAMVSLHDQSSNNSNILPSNTTNRVLVLGEMSPYISSATSDANGLVTLSGQRLDLPGNILNVNGVASTVSLTSGPITSTKSFTLPSGNHFIKITNSRTGDSNTVYVDVQVSQQTVTPPTVSMVGTPVLALTYDSAQKESVLTATFDVSVTAGTNPFQVYRLSVSGPPMYYFNVDLRDSNGTRYSGLNGSSVTSFRSGFARGDGTIFTLDPGRTSTFRVVQTFNPKILFAGAYTASAFLYNQADSNTNALPSNTTNRVLVLGEMSPYISSATSDANGLVTLSGQRLDLPGNILNVDGIASTISLTSGPISSTKSFTLPNGGHFIKITNTRTGDSNQVYVNVQGTPNQNPIGNNDGVYGGIMGGWSYDPDAPTQSNTVEIYIDGEVGVGTLLATMLADKPSPDVNTAKGITGNHRFVYTIPALYKDGRAHTLYLYGLDINNGQRTFFPSAKSFTISPPTASVFNGYIPQDSQVLGASTICVNLPRNFHRGDESDRATKLQQFLKERGFLADEPTGFYGDKTVEAVKAYQSSKNLPVTGMVFDFTREAIRNDSCGY